MKRFFIGLEIVLLLLLIYTVISFKKSLSLDGIELLFIPLFVYFGFSILGIFYANIISSSTFVISKCLLICALFFAILFAPRFKTIVDIIPIIILVSVVLNWKECEDNVQSKTIRYITKKEEFIYYFFNFLGCLLFYVIITLLLISKKEQQDDFYSHILIFAGVETALFWSFVIYFILFDKEYKYSKTIKILLIFILLAIILYFRNMLFEYSDKIYWLHLMITNISVLFQNIYLGEHKNAKSNKKIK